MKKANSFTQFDKTGKLTKELIIHGYDKEQDIRSPLSTQKVTGRAWYFYEKT